MKGENFVEDIDFYFDKSGLMVFTEKYHLQRGYCCGNGCRHCPFNYENVADLKKKELLKKNNSPEKES
jgi:hypothetical protein